MALVISEASAGDASALAGWLRDHAGHPERRCLHAWAGEPLAQVEAELRANLGTSLAYVIARGPDGIVGVMGCAWVPGSTPHGWLRGPVVLAGDDREHDEVAQALAQRLMSCVPRLSSLTAYPGAENQRLLRFYRKQGLQAGELSHVYGATVTAGEWPSMPALNEETWPSFRELFTRMFPGLVHMTAHLERPNGQAIVLVVAEGARVDGFVVARLRPHRDAEIVALGVRAEARRRGIGTTLMNSAFGWCARQEQPRLSLTVLDTARPAMALYERNGFTRLGSGFDMLVVADSQRMP